MQPAISFLQASSSLDDPAMGGTACTAPRQPVCAFADPARPEPRGGLDTASLPSCGGVCSILLPRHNPHQSLRGMRSSKTTLVSHQGLVKFSSLRDRVDLCRSLAQASLFPERVRRSPHLVSAASWKLRDSNPRSSRCERVALPAELSPHVAFHGTESHPSVTALSRTSRPPLVESVGFEPTTVSLQGRLAT